MDTSQKQTGTPTSVLSTLGKSFWLQARKAGLENIKFLLTLKVGSAKAKEEAAKACGRLALLYKEKAEQCNSL